MTDKKYEYFDSDSVFRVADNKTERYDGNGVWTETPWNPVKAMDFDRTIRITEDEAKRYMEITDQELKRRQNGYYDD